MSFFGFDQPNSLEEEKRRFLESGANAAHEGDVPVYTWGEESYDGLGDALQEGGDELNDETFGGGPVGKDFDFGHQALPAEGLPQHYEPSRARDISPAKHEQQHQHGAHQSSAPSRPAGTLESLWENKSPFSLLPKTANSGAAATAAARTPQSVPYNSAALDRLTPAPKFSPFGPEAGDAIPAAHQQPMTLSLGANHNHGVRTLEEIEAEMREAFAAQRLHSESPSQQQLYAQGQIRSASAQRHHLPPQFSHGTTPPPRMHPQRELHAQSPRFQQQQQQQQHQQIHLLQQQQQQMQLLELQELRERQQQQQLLELQEQLRAEEIERQRQQQAQQQHLRQQQALREAQMHQHHRQQSSGTPIGDMPYRRQQAHRAVTPSRLHQPQPHADVPFQQSMQFLPREIQMQQKLLAEMAQAEFLHSLQNSPVRDMGESREVTEMLRAEAMRKIMEAERMEERRRRKLEKIRYMSRYNDLMTQSDKDFITRIQVSQLVTQDPYSDDFYAQVYGAIQRSRHGLNHDAPEALLRFSSGGGVGLGLHQIKGGRRPSAMQRMEQQVERIVNNARMREKEKTSLNNLQGALGKTAGRSYKAAPRQLLQVGGNGASSPSPAHAHISKADVALEREGAAREAAAFGKEALGPTNGQELVKKDPLTLKEALMILERLFDITVELDLHKAKPEEPEAADEWEMGRQELIDKLWDGLRVMVPLETSNPHPFISLLAPSKGKKLLPRVMRYLDTSRNLTIVTLMVACFSQLDVVRNAPIVDRLTDTPARKEALIQSNEFVNTQMQYVIPVCAKCSVRIISGLLGLLLDRNDVTAIAQTPAGITMLTIFLSRVETVRHDTSILEDEKPTPEELVQWQLMFDHLFQLLTPHFLYLFPSVRQALANDIPIANVPDSDLIDQPTWQFLAAVGTQSSVEQQQVLVTSLRERVLENVASVSKGWVTDDEQRRMRLANVNIFLNALGLDSSQIAL